MKYGMYLFTELFWDKIKINRKIKKAIYLDEIWRLIGVTSNKEVASFIYKIFKTIRKYGGSSVAITQDISDIFSLDNGTYGKSILNNSSIKTFFALEEEKTTLGEKIIETYSLKGITFDDKSLLKFDNKKISIKPTFKDSNDMPILEDLYNLLNDEKTKKFKIKLLPFVKGSLKYFNNYTNIEINNKLILADVYELGEDNLKYAIFLFTELFWDQIKKDRSINKAIYLDEIWRLIGVTSNKEVASFIYKIFKTIRKYGGSAVAITQDISDLFSLENGIYGKSILNNSSIKNFFSMEEENIKILEKYSNISDKEKIEIKWLKRGECLMFAGEEHLLTKVEVSDFEKSIINGGENN